MNITDEQEERCAIIAEGCKITQRQADILYAEQIRVSTPSHDHLEQKVARIREMAMAQKVRSLGVSTKLQAAGE